MHEIFCIYVYTHNNLSWKTVFRKLGKSNLISKHIIPKMLSLLKYVAFFSSKTYSKKLILILKFQNQRDLIK